jgi:hypothetical protein
MKIMRSRGFTQLAKPVITSEQKQGVFCLGNLSPPLESRVHRHGIQPGSQNAFPMQTVAEYVFAVQESMGCANGNRG